MDHGDLDRKERLTDNIINAVRDLDSARKARGNPETIERAIKVVREALAAYESACAHCFSLDAWQYKVWVKVSIEESCSECGMNVEREDLFNPHEEGLFQGGTFSKAPQAVSMATTYASVVEGVAKDLGVGAGEETE